MSEAGSTFLSDVCTDTTALILTPSDKPILASFFTFMAAEAAGDEEGERNNIPDSGGKLWGLVHSDGVEYAEARACAQRVGHGVCKKLQYDASIHGITAKNEQLQMFSEATPVSVR